jgi:hypothetical protein
MALRSSPLTHYPHPPTPPHSHAATPSLQGPFGNPAHGWDYYQKCMVGGILSCGLTHLAVTPLDVVKCRMQVRKGGGAKGALRPCANHPLFLSPHATPHTH